MVLYGKMHTVTIPHLLFNTIVPPSSYIGTIFAQGRFKSYCLRRFFKIIRIALVSLLLLLLTAVVSINFTPVQNYLAHRGSAFLSKKLNTKVAIEHVRIDFLNHLLIQGLLIKDQWGDTLLYAGEAQVRITDWFLFKDKPALHYLGLKNTLAHLYRMDNSATWNYEFIGDAFSTNNQPDNDTATSKPFEFDLEKIDFENVRFHFDDKWVGEDQDYDIGSLYIDARGLDFQKKLLDVGNIAAKNVAVTIREYTGGRPKHLRPKFIDTFDTTPFNPGMWGVVASKITLQDCSFYLEMDDKKPIPGLFDENHLAVTGINALVEKADIVGDTIHGQVLDFTARDRCGLSIKTMRSKVTVSPIASICEDLYLETGHSKLKDYYAMHYKHFPNFPDYIDSVTMAGRLKNSIVGMQDIALFAPELNRFGPLELTVSGEGRGTVADLHAWNMSVTDGKTVMKGDLEMKGLPDIYTTKISYTNGELFTTGQGILHYAPTLRNSPNIAIEKITYAYFKGSYTGYIENFAVNGAFTTNLGNLYTNVKMNIPGFNPGAAVYSGTIATTNAEIGILFQQPLLGSVTLKEVISGSSFDPEKASVKMDGALQEFTLNGYAYHNILTHGTLAKKQFTGNLLVDDPNLALEFNGALDYSGPEIKVNATAHLLGSNFHTLNFVTDTVTASADFDLDCTGSNIDNFRGYAKLNNIDLKRNMHKLDLDSILIVATGNGKNKQLDINSNDVTANIKGNYQLSKLPASAQYYLSQYIPNYISSPHVASPAQDFTFNITTRLIDSIFAVTLPIIRGFNNSTFSGSLNTEGHKLVVNATVPYGSVGDFHMEHVTVSGLGSLDKLNMNTNIEHVIIGDNVLHGSLSLTTSVGHDSVAFTVATTTPDSTVSITLDGDITARKDSLFLKLRPSEFYLNKTKWTLAGNSRAAYSEKYLQVDNFALTCGLQKITVNTDASKTTRPLIIHTENLDLAQIGTWAGLGGYHPEGRLSGNVAVDNLFENLIIRTDLNASAVKLGNDTIGNILAIGSYDNTKRLIWIDNKSGIYRGNAALNAGGTIILDTTSTDKLDGQITLTNAPVSWSAPFLEGFLSQMKGIVNGNVSITGTAADPIISGKVKLQDAAMRVDYLGCNYTIPSATATIDNKRITIPKMLIYDSYRNQATAGGYFSHKLFQDFRMRLTFKTNKFEVLNLASTDNDLFYGHVIASLDSFTVRGPFNNMRLNAFNAAPVAKSQIYIPVTFGGDLGTYSYVSFKEYGTAIEKAEHSKRDKMHINLDANLNNLAEIHIVLDPAAGDEIMARGDGNIQMDIPPDNDMRLNGQYRVDAGTYTFTFNKIFTRQFRLSQGSTINFNGAFAETNMNMDATYPVKARLYDLLNDADKQFMQGSELTDAQTPQWVNVLLHMNGSLFTPRLTFDLEVEDKRLQGNLAYRKLMLINNDDRQKFDQVASLLLINSFIPVEGGSKSSVATGAINNVSQILSNTASTGLTNILNKLTGDKQLNVAVKYTNYNYNDQSTGGLNRNQLKASVNRSYFNDHLLVELGSTSDWGKPSSATSSSSFNITGDFRLQYLLSQTSGLRLNVFRTSDYDVTLDRDIVRSGVGITWRKSFDNLGDFFRSNAYMIREKAKMEQKMRDAEQDTVADKNAPVEL